MCLRLQSKVVQRERNLSVQLSERKGTLTHTVSDCELAQGCALHRVGLWAQGCTLHRAELWAERHSCVLQRTAASSLQPTFSSWFPSACLISPQVQLLHPTFKVFNKCKRDSLTDTGITKLIYEQLWQDFCGFLHIYLHRGLESGNDMVNNAVFLYNSEAGGALCGWCK